MLGIIIIILIVLTIWGVNFISNKKLKEFNFSVKKITENFFYEKENKEILSINKKYKFEDKILRSMQKRVKTLEEKNKDHFTKIIDHWNNLKMLEEIEIEKENYKKSKDYGEL